MLFIEIQNDNKYLFVDLITENPKTTRVIKSKSAINTDTLQIALTLTPVIVAAVSAIIIEMIKSKKEFTLKNGIKEISLKGFSDKAFNDDKIQSIISEFTKDNTNNTEVD